MTDKCNICYEHDCSVKTSCNHQFCTDCIVKWTKLKQNCPYCRAEFTDQECFELASLNKRVLRSSSFRFRRGTATRTMRKMIDEFENIRPHGVEKQGIKIREIIVYFYENISLFVSIRPLMLMFADKLDELAKSGVTECSIIRFKLRERNIFIH